MSKKKEYITCNLAFHRGMRINLLSYLERSRVKKDGSHAIEYILDTESDGKTIRAHLNYLVAIEFPRDKDSGDYNDFFDRSISLTPSEVAEFEILLDASMYILSYGYDNPQSPFRIVRDGDGNELRREVIDKRRSKFTSQINTLFGDRIGTTPIIVSRKDDLGMYEEEAGIALDIVGKNYRVDFTQHELMVFSRLFKSFDFASLALNLINTYMLSTGSSIHSGLRRNPQGFNSKPKDVNVATGKNVHEKVGGSLMRSKQTKLDEFK